MNDRERFLSAEASSTAVMSSGELAVKQEITRRKAWQAMVVAHERTHMLVAGSMASSPVYTYAAGPDGKLYITGGEVQFAMPISNDPTAILRNLARVKAAKPYSKSTLMYDSRAKSRKSTFSCNLQNATCMLVATLSPQGTESRDSVCEWHILCHSHAGFQRNPA